jgi:excisionase family DNA binding protein
MYIATQGVCSPKLELGIFLSNEQSPRKDLNVPSILTVPEVADIFRVSRKTVFGWLSDGKLPHIRTPGRGIRIKREHIEALLNAGETARNAA